MNKKHGLSNSPTYNTWRSMIGRCYCPYNYGFKRYSSKGIVVCERWKTSFVDFLKDMGLRPEGMEIDRIDNDGNYEPGNCRWVTRKENLHNTRKTIRSIPFVDGESREERHKKTMALWSLKNRNRILSKKKEWRKKNVKHCSDYSRKYYAEWYPKNRLRKLEYMRLRYLKKKALNEAHS